MRGVVKFFSDKKGWGFIVAGPSPDVFVHQSSIKMNGRRTLKIDQIVEFDEVSTDKGREAKNVRVVDETISVAEAAPKPSSVTEVSPVSYRVVVDVNLDAIRYSAINCKMSVRDLISDAFDAAYDKFISQLVLSQPGFDDVDADA